MIIVTAPEKDGVAELEFDTNAFEILDACLVIHQRVQTSQGFAPMAAFAAGAWITVEVVDDAD